MKGYVTKRIAPTGYKAVTKPLAAVLYAQGKAITLCGNNVNHLHVFDGWQLGVTVQKQWSNGYTFVGLVVRFCAHLEPELGTYAVYYVREKDI